MSDSLAPSDDGEQLEIIELLDERFRLREDPGRTLELEDTHARLRESLHRAARAAAQSGDEER
jgi:hypothetical protein